jgi:GT2 family glycosyltransferase
MSRVGIVAIGRNEGERFRRCLRSLPTSSVPVVYVDSGSDDGSVPAALASGASVVELDNTISFTAARARNAGLEKLVAEHPEIAYVQFIDGDCELDPGWLATALAALEANPDLAVVCGRRRELFPERSIYNELCDIEWDTPVGDAKACGGDALMRVSAFRAAGGFSANLIAGEEPELCVRLRKLGFRIRRLRSEMTRHDAAVLRFSQWWKRTLRSGHAFAQGAAMHGGKDERHWVRETGSIVAWALLLPLAVLVLLALGKPWGLVLLAPYPALAARIWLKRREGLGARRAALFALFCVLAKFPQLLGAARFLRFGLGGAGGLIEYKLAPQHQSVPPRRGQ